MRISKVSTRKGDKGRTSLGTGERVDKDHPVVEFMGEVDELNSQIGLSISFCENESLIRDLSSIQQDLFNIGGEASLLNSDLNLLKEDRLDFLELNIKKYNENLPPLKDKQITLGVVSFMRDQSDRIREEAPLSFSKDELKSIDFMVGTPEDFQGNERDIRSCQF